MFLCKENSYKAINYNGTDSSFQDKTDFEVPYEAIQKPSNPCFIEHNLFILNTSQEKIRNIVSALFDMVGH